jgi:hypothetical protein
MIHGYPINHSSDRGWEDVGSTARGNGPCFFPWCRTTAEIPTSTSDNGTTRMSTPITTTVVKIVTTVDTTTVRVQSTFPATATVSVSTGFASPSSSSLYTNVTSEPSTHAPSSWGEEGALALNVVLSTVGAIFITAVMIVVAYVLYRYRYVRVGITVVAQPHGEEAEPIPMGHTYNTFFTLDRRYDCWDDHEL